ncbi:hypothetical protein [Alteromonas sp. W364]|jgi:hypothetical protein|uniref:hypothetical protein n=1 Tax=Alteromonas sp. W364 TaxID=3075610 RepID=UPI002883F9B9|nr:hypothetical protein [Alteromonas sp. W364]MDT0627273.1 hypothetical protein [Alteromonas sp. W364]
MKKLLPIAIAILGGLSIAFFGAHLTGYTAAFAMPKSFNTVLSMLLWDIFVVQLLGFGLLAAAFAFLYSRLCTGSFLNSVIVVFGACQVSLMYPFTYSIYWVNFFVILCALIVGYLTAKVTYNNTLENAY